MNASQQYGNNQEMGNNSQEDNGQKRKIPNKIWIWFIGLLILNFFIGKFFADRMSDLEKVPYTVFKEEVLKHNVKEIYSKGSSLSGNFINPVTIPVVETHGLQTDTASVKVTHFTTEIPSFIDPGLETLLIENGVTIRAEPIQEEKNPLWSFLLMFGPTILIIAFYFSMYRRMQQSGSGSLWECLDPARQKDMIKEKVRKLPLMMLPVLMKQKMN